MFNKGKPKLGDKVTWDVNILFDYFRKLGPNKKLSLQQLSEKTVTLLMLANMCRKCELLYLALERVVQNTDNKMTFKLDMYTKTVNQEIPQKRVDALCTFTICKFKDDERLCPLAAIREYIKRTALIRKKNKLFVFMTSPFMAAASATVTRWVKKCMLNAGIDTSVYSVHSIRSASSTTAVTFGTPVKKVLTKAGWKNVNTFVKTYFRPHLENKETKYKYKNSGITSGF